MIPDDLLFTYQHAKAFPVVHVLICPEQHWTVCGKVSHTDKRFLKTQKFPETGRLCRLCVHNMLNLQDDVVAGKFS